MNQPRQPTGETAEPDDVEAPPGGDPDDDQQRVKPREIAGPKGPEPTRYGDWERNGRCSDF